MNKEQQFDSGIPDNLIHEPTVHMWMKFKSLGPTVPEKRVTNI